LFLGNWNRGIRYFTDVGSKNNLYVHAIRIDTTAAKWCTINTTLKFYLHDELLGELFIAKEECNCYSCPYPHTFEATFNKFTKYNYGGINTLRIDPGPNVICIGSLKISLTFKSINYVFNC
jgi:hypothetical protein